MVGIGVECGIAYPLCIIYRGQNGKGPGHPGDPVWDPYQKYNTDKVERVQSSKVGIQDTLVFLICLMCWVEASFLKENRRLDLFCFYKIINGLANGPFKGVLVEAFKGTRRKHNIKSFFPKTISAWN